MYDLRETMRKWRSFAHEARNLIRLADKMHTGPVLKPDWDGNTLGDYGTTKQTNIFVELREVKKSYNDGYVRADHVWITSGWSMGGARQNETRRRTKFHPIYDHVIQVLIKLEICTAQEETRVWTDVVDGTENQFWAQPRKKDSVLHHCVHEEKISFWDGFLLGASAAEKK